MLVVLSAGLLTVLTGTAVSQIQPAFADDEEECNENGSDSCNEVNHNTEQEINCKIFNENENDDKSDENRNRNGGNGDITCWNFAQNADRDTILDEDIFDPFA